MGSVGKTVVLSGLIENGSAEGLSELFANKKEQVCMHLSVCTGSAVRCEKWERGGQTGVLVMAGGDKLQAICVIRFSNMESASE